MSHKVKKKIFTADCFCLHDPLSPPSFFPEDLEWKDAQRKGRADRTNKRRMKNRGGKKLRGGIRENL